MPPISPDAILTQLHWRFATKKFDSTKKIAPEVWAKLEEAMVLAPSSYGLQPWKFIVVTDPAMRKKLHPASWSQAQILDASHLVVLAARNPPTPGDVERHVLRTAEVRGLAVEALDGLSQKIVGSLARMSGPDAHAWATRQTYLALGIFLAACAMAGVDACPMEGFQPEAYDEILGLKEKGLSAVVLAAAGYRRADDPAAKLAKSRFDVEEVIERI